MNHCHTIRFSDFDVHHVLDRSLVKIAFHDVPNVQFVVINLEKIDFLSRSAAHEIITQMEVLRAKGTECSFNHNKPNVSKMLEVVQKSRKSNIKSNTYLEILHHETEDELEAFLKEV